MTRRGTRPAPAEASAADLVQPPPRTALLEERAKVAAGMKGWKPAREVLKRVRALPTIFPGFDQGTRVGGLPLGRIMTIHGPSNEGKSVMALGLMLSFLRQNQFVAHVDAERTTSITWVEMLMAGQADNPLYLAMRPTCFEEVDDSVRSFLSNIQSAKRSGAMPADATGLVVVDSIRKLVPRDLMRKLLKEGTDKVGADGMRGRGAQHRAAIVAQWLDELVPMLDDSGCAMLLIARETEDPEADANDRKYGNDYRVTGGKSIIYDASLVARIERAAWVYHGKEDDKQVVGERHRARIWKTKVGGKDDRHIDTYFHTSNGALVPEGFDRARDVVELAKEMGIIAGDAWLSFGRHKWQGRDQAVKRLGADPELLAEVEARVRAGFVLEGQEPVAE